LSHSGSASSLICARSGSWRPSWWTGSPWACGGFDGPSGSRWATWRTGIEVAESRSGDGDLYGKTVAYAGGTAFERIQAVVGYEAGIERGMFKALSQFRESQQVRKKEEAEVIEIENIGCRVCS